VPWATHGSAQTILRENLTVSGADELAPTIGVKDELGNGAPLTYRHAQGRDGQWSIHAAQPTTRRLKTSKTATRYNQPRAVSSARRVADQG